LLSYDLARILVEQLAKPSWPAFARFVTHAKRTDAGSASAKEHLGIDLGPSASALVCKPRPTCGPLVSAGFGHRPPEALSFAAAA
jgi:hypothetical protein